MGCSSSKEVGDAPPPRKAPMNRPVEDRTWVAESNWSRTAELFSQYIADREDGRELALESREPGVVFASVRTYLGGQYRDCGYRNSIEDLFDLSVSVRSEGGSTAQWPSRIILVMDSCFTGEIVAVALAVAVPVDDSKPWLMPGDIANSEAMEDIREHLTSALTKMEQRQDTFQNAEILVFAGADAMRSRWRPSITEPTITSVEEKLSKSASKSMDQLGKLARDFPEPMGLYNCMNFHALLDQLHSLAPETTVWDEGELPFSVGGSPYRHPTRLLVTRDEAVRDKEVEATEHKIIFPEWHLRSQEQPDYLWRNADPDKDPGGIVAVCLAISTGTGTAWPKVGDFLKGPVPKAAADALLALVKQWHRQGKVQRCVVKVDMGFDALRYSFIGSKLVSEATEAPNCNTPVVKRPGNDLDGFWVKLEEQPKHHLFDSEEHFQGIKALMTERMLNDPERFKALALETAKRSVARLLEVNYPGKEISVEEELPITFNGRAAETTLVIARHPGRKDKDIVAAVYCIPSPDGESIIDPTGTRKEWLGTPEARAAVAALLGRFGQWQREGRIADGECMGQMLMGHDADVYLFKDGRFEDPSEERMGQIKWG